MIIEAGTKLGPYEVLESIGAGGMGEVWKARDTRLDRDVAVKFLTEAFSANETFRARFEREAKVISSLKHPNICTLYDVGEADGRNYLVMELVEGESLSERIARGPLPLPQVIKSGAQIAEALDQAHSQGVVHRDLKPGNVMLTRTDAKLLDFGLARTESQEGPVQVLTDLPTAHKPLTQEGTILGTFQYMAPEQLEGQEADARTDIFALGALLYEMATGRRAFEGSTKTSLIAAIVSSQPEPVASVVPVAPPALDHVIRQCLEKDPEDRWQSARDVARELRWISEAGSQTGLLAPVASTKKRREQLKSGLVVVFAALSMALGWLALRPPAAAPDTAVRFQIGAPADRSTGSYPDVSPDGTMIAFLAFKDGGSEVWIRNLDTFESRRLEGVEPVGGIFWAPSSDAIAFWSRDRKLKRVGIDGQTPVTICDVPPGTGGTWNDDGVIIFGSGWGEGLYRVDANGGDPVPLTALDQAKRESVHLSPNFFSDGNHFAFFGRTAHGVNNEIYVASLDDPRPKPVTSADALATVMPDDSLLLVRQGRALIQEFDLSTVTTIGEASTVVERVRFSAPGGSAAIDVGGDVLSYALPDVRDVALRWRDRRGEILEETGFTGPYGGLSLSPDSRYVLASRQPDEVNGQDLWVLELERSLESRLTTHPAGDIRGLWSPDGSRIYFQSDRRGLWDFFSIDSDGGTEPELLFGDEILFDKFLGSLSPDGKRILFTVAHAQTSGDIHELDLETAKWTPLLQSEFDEDNAAYSPDGEWFAYVSDQSGRREVYLRRIDGAGSRVRVSTDGGDTPIWLEGEVIYTKGQQLFSASVRLEGDRAAVSAPTLLYEFAQGVSVTTLDGQRFLQAEPLEADRDLTPIRVVKGWR